MRILVVEDEFHVADLIRRALENQGNTCMVAATAAEAERLLDEQKVDAVTLDLAMPGKNGLDWLEDIAGRRPDLARRTLVITGAFLEADLVDRVRRCGAGVLAKPFSLDRLAEAVRCQIAHVDWRRRAAMN